MSGRAKHVAMTLVDERGDLQCAGLAQKGMKTTLLYFIHDMSLGANVKGGIINSNKSQEI